MTDESQTPEPVEGTTEDTETQTPTPAPVEESADSDASEAEVTEPPTLREFFDLPETASDKSDERWAEFQETLAEEAKGIKWMAAMPDLGAKICELLDIKIHNVMLTAWKKVEAVRQAMEDSKQDPEKAVYLELTEHSIDYETKPFIDVKIKSASVKKLTLNVSMNLKIKGFGLKIQDGLIRELQTGKCEGKGTIKYEKLPIAEKKLEPIKFPFSIKIPNLIPTVEPEDNPPQEKLEPAPTQTSESETSGDHERIEL